MNDIYTKVIVSLPFFATIGVMMGVLSYLWAAWKTGKIHIDRELVKTLLDENAYLVRKIDYQQQKLNQYENVMHNCGELNTQGFDSDSPTLIRLRKQRIEELKKYQKEEK